MREDVYRKMAEHVIEGLKKRNMEGIYCETGGKRRPGQWRIWSARETW